MGEGRRLVGASEEGIFKLTKHKEWLPKQRKEGIACAKAGGDREVENGTGDRGQGKTVGEYSAQKNLRNTSMSLDRGEGDAK